MLFSDDLPQQQQVLQLQSSGSFTGYRPQLQQLGHHYLSASDDFKQPLCGNEEGWGPLSPFRYDFTPCFIDVWVASVAVFGIVFGSLALWYVLRKSKAADVAKDWHFWTKQVRFALGPAHLLSYNAHGARGKPAQLTSRPVTSRSRHRRYRRPVRLPNSQPPQRLVQRLSCLDDRPHLCLAMDGLCDPVG